MSCLQLNSENNGQGLLFTARLYYDTNYVSCHLIITTDSKDGNRLKLENIGLKFSSFDAFSTKKTEKLIMGCSLKHL